MSILHKIPIVHSPVSEDMSTEHVRDASTSELSIANTESDFPRVSLKESTDSSYVHLAAEIDGPLASFLPIFLFDSGKKRTLIAACKELCQQLRDEDLVVDATVFKATLIPPGQGEYLDRTDEDVHIAKFDVVVLIEVEDEAALQCLKRNEKYVALESTIVEDASYSHITAATNVKRIDSVNHERDGIFLFNYFFAESTRQNIEVWEYTAGWFEAETGLDNSTLLVPDDPDRSEYALINHCRWERLRDVLPSIRFKSSFEEYVLANFEANRVAAIPILYKLA